MERKLAAHTYTLLEVTLAAFINAFPMNMCVYISYKRDVFNDIQGHRAVGSCPLWRYDGRFVAREDPVKLHTSERKCFERCDVG